MLPYISIIVPVYNVEQYLRRCLDSIHTQTFNDWECILVDDGSTDDSGKICDEYCDIDNRFIVVHKRNEGVSRARNYGIDISRGEYVSFVDSDDWIEKDGYLIAVKTIQESKADIVKYGFTIHSLEGTSNRSVESKKSLASHDGMLMETERCNYCGFLWNGLYRRELIADLRMDESINWCEDQLFSFELFLRTNKMVLLPDIVYHYQQIHTTPSLSDVRDPYMVLEAANKEYELKMKFVRKDDLSITNLTVQSYNNKLKKLISILYNYKSYSYRKEFRKATLNKIFHNDVFELKVFYSISNIRIIDCILCLYYKIKQKKYEYLKSATNCHVD